jgi:hypothetical protein
MRAVRGAQCLLLLPLLPFRLTAAGASSAAAAAAAADTAAAAAAADGNLCRTCSRNSPNSLFDEALEFVKEDADVVARLGTPVKGYGQDHGGNREGRRNFIQSADVPGAVEGESNLRIKFNLEGPYNKAQCYAEVQKNMDRGKISVRSAARVCASRRLTRPPAPPPWVQAEGRMASCRLSRPVR